MSSTAIYKCKHCGSDFTARTADRARGWARYCSKSCKATKQTLSGGGKSRFPRHDGKSEMKHRHCETCGNPAVNGVYGITGRIEWYCERHMIEATEHPFSSDSLGQW